MKWIITCYYRWSVPGSKQEVYLPQTIKVKLAPRWVTILWRWFGRLAMPIPGDDVAVGAISIDFCRWQGKPRLWKLVGTRNKKWVFMSSWGIAQLQRKDAHLTNYFLKQKELWRNAFIVKNLMVKTTIQPFDPGCVTYLLTVSAILGVWPLCQNWAKRVQFVACFRAHCDEDLAL